MLFECKKVVVKIIGEVDHYYFNTAIDYMCIKLVLKITLTIFDHRNTYLSHVSYHTSLSVRLSSKINKKKQFCLMMRHFRIMLFFM